MDYSRPKPEGHISNVPWGVRTVFEVNSVPSGPDGWRKRQVHGTYFSKAEAERVATTKKANVSQRWAVRCGTFWFILASVRAVSINAEGLGPTDSKPEDEPSIYTRIEPESVWIPIGDPYVRVQVKHIVSPLYGEHSKASSTQVLYVRQDFPDHLRCHPATRWHTHFVELESKPNYGFKGIKSSEESAA